MQKANGIRKFLRLVHSISDRLSVLRCRAGERARSVAAQRFPGTIPMMAALMAVMLTLILGTRIVAIQDGESEIVFKTMASDINAIVDESGIDLGEYDSIVVRGEDRMLTTLSVNRAFAVRLRVDGQITQLYAQDGCVSDVLMAKGVALGAYDVINHQPEEYLSPGMEIVINRVSYETVVQETATPYQIRRIESTEIPKGRAVEVTKGQDGLDRSVTRIKYVDGEQVESEVISTEVVREPVTAVIRYGSGGTFVTSRGESLRFSHYLNVTATAYTYGDGGPRNITATGKPVKVGYVAVDPRVIPLGSRLYITWPNGTTMYGYAVAEDTGGSIKGSRIDLFFESRSEALCFGVRRVRVYVLE